MANPFLGEIEYFAFGFAPKGWAPCAGQLMPVSQNQALFSLLGTTYGGDGSSTFGLPDLRGRVAIDQGAGTGLSTYVIGQVGGQESVVLTTQQIPPHTHDVAVAGQAGTESGSPAGNVLSIGIDGTTAISVYATGNATGAMSQTTVGNGGGNQPHDNRMPYLVLTPCIAIAGIYPSRS